MQNSLRKKQNDRLSIFNSLGDHGFPIGSVVDAVVVPQINTGFSDFLRDGSNAVCILIIIAYEIIIRIFGRLEAQIL